jgi:hypothetical protein
MSRSSSLHTMPHLPPAHHETSKRDCSNETKIKEKQNETISDSNSNLAKSMTHHNQTKELTTWFLNTTVDDFFDHLFIVWRQLDILCPQLSPATCQSCKDHTAALELHRTYDFLTWLRDKFEPLCAQLLTCRPYVSLMDALVEVHNEEIRLRDAGLLQSTTVLVAHSSAGHSSSARHAAPVPLASPPVVPPAARGESGGLYCDHDGHVEALCYMKKKTQKSQTHRSS